MRLYLLIIFLHLSFPDFAQDSLGLDSIDKIFDSPNQNTVIADSNSSYVNYVVVKKSKKQRQKEKKIKGKEELVVITKDNTKVVYAKEDETGPILIVLLLITLITVFLVFKFSPTASTKTDKHGATLKDEDFISDYLSRMLLPRREYYRNVYLKSEAWKRKRYIVLKRDNWRCVYCGERATEVHHTRYARWQIGKEPIKWLVSICRICHEIKYFK